MNADTIQTRTPPAPPPASDCEACGKPVQHRLRDGWDASRALSPTFATLYAYERIGHEECAALIAEKLQRKFALELVEGARASRAKARVEWYSLSGTPKDAAEKTFDSFVVEPDNRVAFDRARAWRAGDDFGFLISGPAGTGKSHLGFAVLNYALDQFVADDENGNAGMTHMPAYVSVSEMLAEMRAKQGTSEIPWRTTSRYLVMFDDLGTESITDWSRDVLFRIFDLRLNQKLPTIVTTNLSLSELKERLHERVISRILGNCVPLTLKGKDRRLDLLAEKIRILNGRVQS